MGGTKAHFFRQSAGGVEGGLHHYSFEETSGITVFDSIGETNGTIQGTPTFGEVGRVGSCLSVVGPNQKIQFDTDLGLTTANFLDGGFTVRLWFFMETLLSATLFGPSNSTSFEGINISFQKWFTNGRVNVQCAGGIYGGSTVYTSDVIAVSLGWNQVSVRVNAFHDVDILLNNVVLNKVINSESTTNWDFDTATYRLIMSRTGVLTDHLLDEISTFDKALTDEELTTYYELELAGTSII